MAYKSFLERHAWGLGQFLVTDRVGKITYYGGMSLFVTFVLVSAAYISMGKSFTLYVL